VDIADRQNSNITRGRDDLASWLASQPENYFQADDGLSRGLGMLMGDAAYGQFEPSLDSFGREAAAIDGATRENNLHANLPRLDVRDGIGRVQDRVTHHPSYHEVGRAIYGSGVMTSLGDSEFPNLKSLSLFYISSMNGEAGHNCPLACTAGIIKVLQHVANDELREKYLPGLLDPDYDTRLHGAQFLTEIQGGSDVGANATTALPVDGSTDLYTLVGEKWFCSNIDADLTLMTARLDDPAKGTSGLGLFLLPLRTADGSPNGYRVWRLKDKLGTRSMASAEIELNGAPAHRIGDQQSGFRHMMRYVIHTSRLFNAMACLGNMRRATLVGASYARHRGAFGHKIGDYPLVQETIADMRSDTAAARAATLRLLHQQDTLEVPSHDSTVDAAAQRMAVNLNKTISARFAHEVINQGIELLGGNGAIESFSVLPRLLRDNVVFENWEGTHNTLLAQWLRDAKGRNMDTPFFAWLRGLLEALPTDGCLTPVRSGGLSYCAELEQAMLDLRDMDDSVASLRMRVLGEKIGCLMYGACLAAEAAYARSAARDDAEDTEHLARYFYDRRVQPETDRHDAAYLERLAAINQRC